MPYVYTHSKKGTKEVFYIGIGSDTDYKRATHTGSRSDYWKKTYRKYGRDVSIVVDHIPWEEACRWEVYLIGLYGRRDRGKGHLINMTEGGEGNIGFQISDEHRIKVAEANRRRVLTDEQRRRMGERMSQRNRDPEFRAKIIEGLRSSEKAMANARKLGLRMKGKKHSELSKKRMSDSAEKKPIVQYDLNGRFIKIWESSCQIERELKFFQGNVANCCKGRYKQAYGYKWEYYK